MKVLRWFILLFLIIIALFIYNQCTVIVHHDNVSKGVHINIHESGINLKDSPKKLSREDGKEAKKPKHR